MFESDRSWKMCDYADSTCNSDIRPSVYKFVCNATSVVIVLVSMCHCNKWMQSD
jgi:hypothetical protein